MRRRAIADAAVHGESPDQIPPPEEIVRNLSTAMRIEGADHGYAAARDIPEAVRL